MATKTSQITQEIINQQFTYDSITGDLVRKFSKGAARAGSPCRAVHKRGYYISSVNNIPILVHRMIWIMHFGNIPPDKNIDHINGDKQDNRLENLRLTTIQENNQNIRKPPRHNSSGLLGASWSSRECKWVCVISENNKSVRVGAYKTKEEAHQAYLEYKRKIHSGCTI